MARRRQREEHDEHAQRSPPPHRAHEDDDYDGEKLEGGGREQHERAGLSERVDEN